MLRKIADGLKWLVGRPNRVPVSTWTALLLDPNAPIADRDDAAVALQLYDEDEAERSLGIIASDSTLDEVLADSAGHSLVVIWRRKNRLNKEMCFLEWAEGKP